MTRLKDPITKLREYIGRRGVVLLTLATVWLLFGASIATYQPPPGRSGRFDIEIIDNPAWALVWLTCGAVAAWHAVRRRWGSDDAIGWAAGITPALIWAALYSISAIWSLASANAIGSDRAWVGVVTWLLIAGLIRTIAGWEDLLDRARTAEES